MTTRERIAYGYGICLGIGIVGLTTSLGNPLSGWELVFPTLSLIGGLSAYWGMKYGW